MMLRLRRKSDAGEVVETTLSLDPAAFALAAELYGSEDAARERLAQVGQEAWAEDRQARMDAAAAGGEHRAVTSISRLVQRRILTDALAALRRR